MATNKFKISNLTPEAFGKGLKKTFDKWAQKEGGKIYTGGTTKPVKRQLKFSRDALSKPMGKGWLNNTRDFLVRKGAWKRFPLYANEMVVISPNPAAVGEPIVLPPFGNDIFSVGFGDIDITDGFSCGNNTCSGQHVYGCDLELCPVESDTGCSGNCDIHDCDTQSCDEYDCGWDQCSDQKCDNFKCNAQMGNADFVKELNQFKDHPFVKELVSQLKITDFAVLAKNIQQIVCLNGYEQSLLKV